MALVGDSERRVRVACVCNPGERFRDELSSSDTPLEGSRGTSDSRLVASEPHVSHSITGVGGWLYLTE